MAQLEGIAVVVYLVIKFYMICAFWFWCSRMGLFLWVPNMLRDKISILLYKGQR